MAAVVFLITLWLAARLLGSLFAFLRQPRVAGEIIAGILMRPLLSTFGVDLTTWPPLFTGVYWAGLLLLMFFSGAETRTLFRRDETREVTILAVAGTVLPFALATILFLTLDGSSFMGSAGNRTALVLVVGIATAVTSIPVISRIFHDLGILKTRFARLVLSVAVVEDIGLWALLSVAIAIAKVGTLAGSLTAAFAEVAADLLLFVFALKLAPRFAKAFRWPASMLALGCLVLAAATGASMIFAAFLAGLTLALDSRPTKLIEKLSPPSFGSLIPLYFALVGCRIDLKNSFDAAMLAGFLLVACSIKLLAVIVGARWAGFSRLASWNLAVATNARGGPGIVVASVAYDAGIISAAFFTTLIATAILTSQAAGAWLESMLRRGKPLLEEEDAVAVPENIAA
jgi:Kef-type K+ transport system membrane component KefB